LNFRIAGTAPLVNAFCLLIHLKNLSNIGRVQPDIDKFFKKENRCVIAVSNRLNAQWYSAFGESGSSGDALPVPIPFFDRRIL